MAQRVNIVLEDDIDGTVAQETVAFALDGITYEIDLSDANAQKLRDSMTLYTNKARRTGGRKNSTAVGNVVTGLSPVTVRKWAKANGIECPSHGRVPRAVMQAYQDAH